MQVSPMDQPRNLSQSAEKSPTLRVLVVDGEALIRWSVSEVMSDEGCEVVEAKDGKAAVQIVSGSPVPFDVVLLDFRLPDSNDLTLLSTLRRLAPSTQVILMTAFGTPEVAKGAMDLGAFTVVSKPFELAELATLVHQARNFRMH